MKLVSYIIGLIFFTLILFLLIFYPLKILIYPDLAFIGFLKRGVGILILSSFLCLYRILRGPSPSDRIVSIDMLGILIIGICVLLSITTRRSWYIDIGIAWALQSFISTLALAKFLEGKDFDE
ncbi:MAG: monovalent cation/H+ antiporter complex subunit F [Candidatus Omnitrophica bacterium]|nr:monovalent cation/H+ antiporter complex subunit F [Candidatus Omnitrophota bacterium]